MDKKYDFFISYTSTDEPWAKWIAYQLEDAGNSTIIQCWDFVTGNFVAKINDAIKNSERYITVTSPAYLESEWCKAEWTAMFAICTENKDKVFIPVIVEKCDINGLTAPIIYADIVGVNEDEARKRIFDKVNHPGRPTTKPAFPGSVKPAFPPSIKKNNAPKNNLPPRNINFTGREAILDGIHKLFRSGNKAVLTQVVTGLGGIGKTQIVIEYAYRYADDYDVIRFINAETPEMLLKEFTDFAHYLGLVDKDVNERDVILNSVKDWMTNSDRWLFIFDNAEKPEDLKDYIPGFCGGRILLTSRDKGWRLYKELNIEEFTPDEAVEFLVKSTEIEDESGAKELSEALGFLPLALEQAAAYISNTGIDYIEYKKLYEKYKLDIFKGNTGKPKDYSSTVAVTWNISIEKVKNESSKQLLNICSFFSGDGIDKSILPACSECLPEPLAGDVKDELEYNNILYELSRYSLIKDNGDSFSIHRLLQEVIRNSIDEKEWLEIGLKITNEKFEYDQYDMDTWKDCSSVFSHALSIAEYAEKKETGLKEVGRIYNGAGLWLRSTAYPEALRLLEKAIIIGIKVYGKEHPNTAAAYNNIAGVYKVQGEYKKALEWYEKALEIKEKILGKEHPDTATTYNNIAGIYKGYGEYKKALEWCEKALVIFEKVLGKDHPDTATTYNNIASVYKDQGEYTKALEWYAKALEIREKVLGKEHPETATTYNNIAGVYKNQGEYTKALECYQKAIDIDEKVLGKEHPDTAVAYNNIALIYMKQGEYTKALELIIKAYKIYVKRQMTEYPEAKTVFESLYNVYIESGGKDEDFQSWLDEKLKDE